MSISLKHIHAFKTQEYAPAIYPVHNDQELLQIIKKHPSHIILGKGTNTLFIQSIPIPVVVNKYAGIQKINQNTKTVTYSIGGGETWSEIVTLFCESGIWGTEYLAGIPGSVGAAPVKNIGAYGAEFSDICSAVRMYDKKEHTFKYIPKESCRFSYRTSIFSEQPERYIITHVHITLKKENPLAQKQYIQNTKNRDVSEPQTYTPSSIAKEILKTRSKKIPSPAITPNAGSFFKNPILTKSQGEHFNKKNPNLIMWSINNTIKLSAGQLIEKVGMRGYTDTTGAGISPKHALVIINNGTDSGMDIWNLSQKVQKNVYNSFGITMEREVVVYGM